MRTLILNKFLHRNGGSETYIFKLGEALEQHGHEVQYFGMEHEGRCVGNRVNAYTSDMDFHGGSKLSKLTYPIKTIYSKEGLVDDDKGFTNLIVQSSKGERILDRIADRYELYATNLGKAMELDGTMICHSAEPHPRRDEYYLNLDKETLRAHIQKFVPIRIKDYLIEKSKGIFYRMGVYKFLKNKK